MQFDSARGRAARFDLCGRAKRPWEKRPTVFQPILIIPMCCDLIGTPLGSLTVRVRVRLICHAAEHVLRRHDAVKRWSALRDRKRVPDAPRVEHPLHGSPLVDVPQAQALRVPLDRDGAVPPISMQRAPPSGY